MQVHRKVLLEVEPWAIAKAAGEGGGGVVECHDDYDIGTITSTLL